MFKWRLVGHYLVSWCSLTDRCVVDFGLWIGRLQMEDMRQMRLGSLGSSVARTVHYCRKIAACGRTLQIIGRSGTAAADIAGIDYRKTTF